MKAEHQGHEGHKGPKVGTKGVKDTKDAKVECKGFCAPKAAPKALGLLPRSFPEERVQRSLKVLKTGCKMFSYHCILSHTLSGRYPFLPCML